MNDLKSLKAIGEPHYFGLGFIQFKINQTERLHFYHPEIMPILDEEEIHNHRYEFESTVLKGSLFNEIYTFERLCFADYGLYEVSCKKEDAGKEPHMLYDGIPEFICSFEVSKGNKYKLSTQSFHRIKYHEPTITHLKRGNIVSDYARIIKKQDAPTVCPFSKQMEQEEIWNIIEQILEGNK